MNGKKRIFNSLAFVLGISINSFSASSAHASNLHQEGTYDSGNVITYSLGNSHVESTAKRQTLRQENPFTPVFLLGESMGGGNINLSKRLIAQATRNEATNNPITSQMTGPGSEAILASNRLSAV